MEYQVLKKNLWQREANHTDFHKWKKHEVLYQSE